ncbi:hypothetical protein MKW92_049484, partial [Papaver armeniacum]
GIGCGPLLDRTRRYQRTSHIQQSEVAAEAELEGSYFGFSRRASSKRAFTCKPLYKPEIQIKQEGPPETLDYRVFFQDNSGKKLQHQLELWIAPSLPQTCEDPTVANSEVDGAFGDNDPVDVVEIGDSQRKNGEILKDKPLGVLAMIDEGELDWKINAISLDDPRASLVMLVMLRNISRWEGEHVTYKVVEYIEVAWAHPKFGSLLASCSYDGKVIIWKEATAPGALVGSAALDPVQKLVSGGCDNTVKVWKLYNGTWKMDCFPALQMHRDWVRDVSWAPNLGLPKSTIASCSQDGTVIIWTVAKEGDLWEGKVLQDLR